MPKIKRLTPEETSWQRILDNANSLYKDGKHKAAEEKFQEALQLAEGFGSKDTRLATTLNNLGLLYYDQKRYADAEPLYKNALSIREKSLGDEHPLVAMSLSNLALLYYAQKKFSKAAPLCKKALAIREKVLEPNHLDIALSLNNLALIYHGQEKDDKAEPLCERALAIREANLEEGHPLILSSMKNLLKIYKALGNKEKAKSLNQRINSLDRKKSKRVQSNNTQVDNISRLEEEVARSSEESLPTHSIVAQSVKSPSASAPMTQKRRLGIHRQEITNCRHRFGHQLGKRVWGWSTRSFKHN